MDFLAVLNQLVLDFCSMFQFLVFLLVCLPKAPFSGIRANPKPCPAFPSSHPKIGNCLYYVRTDFTKLSDPIPGSRIDANRVAVQDPVLELTQIFGISLPSDFFCLRVLFLCTWTDLGQHCTVVFNTVLNYT